MQLDDSSRQVVQNFMAEPTDARATYALGALYWSTVTSRIGALLQEKKDIREFVDAEREFVNFGLLNEVREDADAVRLTLTGDAGSYPHLRIRVFSEWLIETIEEIVEGNQKELLEQDIKRARIQIERFNKEIASTQESRKELILTHLGEGGSSVPSGALLAQVARLTQGDQLLFDSLKTKKAIAKGVFFSVEQRRAFVGRENQLQKAQAQCEGLVSRIQGKDERAALHNIENRISEIFSKIIALEDSIVRMEKRIEEIKEKQDTISPAEVESRALRAIEYVRDLVKLCARRLRIESCAILRPKDPFFTIQELCACFDRIQEFDPRVFCNERVNYLGKPSVLLVPGNGNAIYDWKNNEFIVPLVPPGGDFVGSIASAIIEYRFDVDDDKKLLNSYMKLPENRGVKSIYRLKKQLTKDYVSWMTSEYKGYRVLSKDAKKWFEHEIAPSRKDIFCPPEYQQFNISTKEFRSLLENVESRLGEEASEHPAEDRWIASILNYQQGKFERAFEHIQSLLEDDSQHLFGYYNLGHIGMKISRKQDAIRGFSEFSKRNPQSWWAGVARDHIRRLQMS
ncbi:MAG: hypothetical protein GF418_10005 [Chitinivibrionales bacterium]|nr:hypothetical protein [Chitinivibrionales bacterium]MBD3395945.1 hypothetical protein [Chitinivibrionales bacterium]